VAVSGWIAGARFGPPRATQAAAGYDIGVAGKPKPTGRVREFQLVAKEALWEIAPGVMVPAITYNDQVPGPLIRVGTHMTTLAAAGPHQNGALRCYGLWFLLAYQRRLCPRGYEARNTFI
jgi:hypothetical protein